MREIIRNERDIDFEGQWMIVIRQSNSIHYRYIEYELDNVIVWRNPFNMDVKKDISKKRKYIKRGIGED